MPIRKDIKLRKHDLTGTAGAKNVFVLGRKIGVVERGKSGNIHRSQIIQCLEFLNRLIKNFNF